MSREKQIKDNIQVFVDALEKNPQTLPNLVDILNNVSNSDFSSNYNAAGSMALLAGSSLGALWNGINIVPSVWALSGSSMKELYENGLVDKIIELSAKPKFSKALIPLLTPELIEDIFKLSALEPHKQYYDLLHDLKSKDLHSLLAKISTHPDKIKRMAAVIADNFDALSKKNPTNEEYGNAINKLLNPIIDLIAVSDNIPEISKIITPKLIDNLCNLKGLQILQPYQKLLKSNIDNVRNIIKTASEHPVEIKEFLNHLIPEFPNLNNPETIIDFADSTLKLLNNKKLLENITDPALLKNIAKNFLNPTTTGISDKKFTEALYKDMPELLKREDIKRAIINACGEEAFEACKKASELVNKLTTTPTLSHIKGKRFSELADEIRQHRQIDQVVGTIKTFAQKAASPTVEAVKTFLKTNRDRLAKSFDNITESSPNNDVSLLLKRFSLKGEDVMYFAPKACSPEGLNAIARYIKSPTGIEKTVNLVRIFIDTGTIPFAVKHLLESYKNGFKELFSSKEKAKSNETEISISELEKRTKILSAGKEKSPVETRAPLDKELASSLPKDKLEEVSSGLRSVTAGGNKVDTPTKPNSPGMNIS